MIRSLLRLGLRLGAPRCACVVTVATTRLRPSFDCFDDLSRTLGFALEFFVVG
jgi:hypothetical protein